MAFDEKNVLSDQPSPEQHDHLNFLIVNKVMWSTETVGTSGLYEARIEEPRRKRGFFDPTGI